MLKLSKLCNKYSGNTYALVEIQLNICRNTMDFMCDLEPFSKIRSHICSTWQKLIGHRILGLRLLCRHNFENNRYTFLKE